MRKYRRPYRRPQRRFTSGNRRSGMGGFRSIILTLLFFSAIIVGISYLPNEKRPTETRDGPVYVIDGDTVVINKVHIRLKGIDAPEMAQTCERNGIHYDCGTEARNFLRARIGRTPIRCETEGFDRYGRDLARCYLGETDLNSWMVQQGWAIAYGDYEREEADARRNGRGIWAGRFEKPSSWRKENPRAGENAQTNHGNTQTIGRNSINAFTDYIKERITALINYFR
ncbi:thermonuclease family protein [Brucella haematophila]|uniref:Thermonuclease family protein n=1 Tax=Brucella haematophila TaxID=419474 RepID=A0ABX1DMN6_9HYPH|nr:thermonuclease family protein [Brucella haematophila]NKC02913.1 thermonuclease family protein [Brucella haematophila]TMV03415.1 thermonuclease family protein [Brucella haematophila]